MNWTCWLEEEKEEEGETSTKTKTIEKKKNKKKNVISENVPEKRDLCKKRAKNVTCTKNVQKPAHYPKTRRNATSKLEDRRTFSLRLCAPRHVTETQHLFLF